MDDKNEMSVLKVAKLPSLRPLALKSKFLLQFEFLKKICMENVAGEQRLHTSNIFHTNPLNFQ